MRLDDNFIILYLSPSKFVLGFVYYGKVVISIICLIND